MRVVVFGGSGFLGSHVADELTAVGHDVIVFDIRKSPYLQSAQTMIEGSILDASAVEKAVQGCDVVYNFAGIADIDQCPLRPVDAIRANVLGNINILEAARKAEIKRFVYASSVYVYSGAGSIYRSTKQASELFTEDYNMLYGIPYTILRYGSLYGERADDWNSIHRFIKEALTTGKINYHGTGEEIREWIHVKDAAQLSVEILKDEYENQRITLTGTQSMKYSTFLEMIQEILDKKVEIVYLPTERADHYKITPYLFNPKLGRKLVCNPHIDLGQGVLTYIQEVFDSITEEDR